MLGHLPGPPQPHLPEGLAPLIGYLATREPSPLDDRPPQEPGWEELPDGLLDEFDDLGDWEPMRHPLMKFTAVGLSVVLVVAGIGTVLEVLLTAH